MTGEGDTPWLTSDSNHPLAGEPTSWMDCFSFGRAIGLRFARAASRHVQVYRRGQNSGGWEYGRKVHREFQAVGIVVWTFNFGQLLLFLTSGLLFQGGVIPNQLRQPNTGRSVGLSIDVTWRRNV